MSKMIDTASHNAAKLRLLTASQNGGLVDATGKPFTITEETFNCEAELRMSQIYIGATPSEHVEGVMELALIEFLIKIGAVNVTEEGEWEQYLSCQELQSRGTWLSSTPDSVHPEYFAWDDTVVLHFVK